MARVVNVGFAMVACWAWLPACNFAAEPVAAPTALKAPASSATDSKATDQPSGAELERAARKTLAELARRKELPDETAVRQLVALYEQLMLATDLPAARREPLRIAVRRRLEADRAILAQVALPQMNAAGPQAQPAATLAPELIALIEDTINPTSWDKLGGPGVIRFWGPSPALVVRQTTEAHEALEELLRDLR
ncbi:MAG TPA: hypothetical protein VG713_09440 [Pirellulales bacterium]|nr:hypothetical protein [Pirellulales bacterium]